MKYVTEIQDAVNDPVGLEELYQLSRQANEEAEFRADLQEVHEKSSDNILLTSWQLRFSNLPLPKVKRAPHWGLAVALGVITGLILWAISDSKLMFLDKIPYVLLLWSPIATILALVFLAVTSRRNYIYTAVAGAGVIIASIYILLIAPGLSQFRSDYLVLMVIQLPLLCWIGIGISTMGFHSSRADRFAFLTKSIEVIIAAGLYLVFGLAFGMITLGMFEALNVTPPDIIVRLGVAGGFGLIPILAIATMYDPHVPPLGQDFSQGLSRFIFTMTRILLPMTLLVLVIYIFVIPFNFWAPFQNRDLLIVYNIMQFAIIGLLIGVTPLNLDDLSSRLQLWLRRGIMAVASLAMIISLYALAAVVYRTAVDIITLNRTTIIGWNIINIAILLALIITQLRNVETPWHERLHQVFSKATIAYLVWSVFLILVLPLLFR